MQTSHGTRHIGVYRVDLYQYACLLKEELHHANATDLHVGDFVISGNRTKVAGMSPDDFVNTRWCLLVVVGVDEQSRVPDFNFAGTTDVAPATADEVLYRWPRPGETFLSNLPYIVAGSGVSSRSRGIDSTSTDFMHCGDGTNAACMVQSCASTGNLKISFRFPLSMALKGTLPPPYPPPPPAMPQTKLHAFSISMLQTELRASSQTAHPKLSCIQPCPKPCCMP